MAASFPDGIKTWTPVVDNVTDVLASHINGAYDEIIATEADINSLQVLVKDPTGFDEPAEVTVTYNSTTRKVTLTGTFVAYWRGKVVSVLTDGWESEAHTDATDIYYLYYNGTNFIWSTTLWTFDMLQIAFAIYGTDSFGMRECHGVMGWATHKAMHYNIGTAVRSGGDFSDYGLDSETVADRRPNISLITIDDEDLPSALSALTSNQYTIGYLTGSAVKAFTTAYAEIVPVTGAVPYYNLDTAGTWSQEAFTDKDYGAIFVLAIPSSADVGSLPYRYIFMQPQQVGKKKDIEALIPADVNLGDFSDLIPEFVFIAKLVVEYKDGDWNISSVTQLTGNKFSQIGTPSGTYLSVVNHDETLDGDGTAADPLTVVSNFKAGNSSFTDDDTAQTFTDTFCTATSLVTIVITGSTPAGVWSVESAVGEFTITSTIAESTDITFDYYINKVVA